MNPRVRKSVAIAGAAICVSVAATGVARSQQPDSLVASAKGEGEIKIGKEEFKLEAVVVKLFGDGKAELQLITEITVFIEGTWSRTPTDEKSIDLKITGSVTARNLSGGGKILLTDDRKSIAGLKLQVVNKVSRRNITADFVAK
jgi:hypothetical protein